MLGLEKTGDGRATLSIFKLRDWARSGSFRCSSTASTASDLDTTTPKRKTTTADEMDELLTEQPRLTQKQLQERTGKSEQAVRDALKDIYAETGASLLAGGYPRAASGQTDLA